MNSTLTPEEEKRSSELAMEAELQRYGVPKMSRVLKRTQMLRTALIEWKEIEAQGMDLENWAKRKSRQRP